LVALRRRPRQRRAIRGRRWLNRQHPVVLFDPPGTCSERNCAELIVTLRRGARGEGVCFGCAHAPSARFATRRCKLGRRNRAGSEWFPTAKRRAPRTDPRRSPLTRCLRRSRETSRVAVRVELVESVDVDPERVWRLGGVDAQRNWNLGARVCRVG